MSKFDSANAAALPKETSSDPVVEIGRQLAIVMAARERLDDKTSRETRPDTPARFDAEADLASLDIHSEALKAAALSQPATTLAGAMVQAAIIYNQVEDELDNAETEKRFEFALFSILDILERESGVSREQFLLDHLTGTRSNIPRRFQEALSAASIDAAIDGNAQFVAARKRRQAVSQNDDPIFAAIERHKTMHAVFSAATNLTDEIRAHNEGREITDADQATFHVAEKAEAEALEALKATAPQTIAGARAAIEYLAKIDDGVDPDLSCTFLETMLNSPLLAN